MANMMMTATIMAKVRAINEWEEKRGAMECEYILDTLNDDDAFLLAQLYKNGTYGRDEVCQAMNDDEHRFVVVGSNYDHIKALDDSDIDAWYRMALDELRIEYAY